MQKRKMKLFVDFNKQLAGTVDVWNEEGTCLQFYAGWYISTMHVVNGKTYKSEFKKFTQHIGVTPTVVRKIVNGFIYEKIHKANPNWSKAFGFATKRSGAYSLFRCIENEPLMQQCKDDKIENIAPLVGLTGKTPAELKRALGKSLWKDLSNRSFSYNRKLSIVASKLYGHKQTDLTQSISELSKLSSTALSIPEIWRDTNWFETFLKSNKIPLSHLNKKHKNYSDTKKLVDIARDTLRLLTEDGKAAKFNPAWSVRRMQEEHDTLVKAQIRRSELAQAEKRNQAVKSVESLEDFIFKNEKGTYTFSLLRTYGEVQDEGTEMRHCVGAYAQACCDGIYLVAKVEGPSCRSTVGFRRSKEGLLTLDQHYGKFNAVVQDEAAKECVKGALRAFNSKIKNGG